MPDLPSLPWLVRWAALCAAVSILTACSQVRTSDPAMPTNAPPEFLITADKSGDRVTVTADAARAIVDVWSESGIGGAHVSLAAGQMPQSVLMRFHLRGLEQMAFAFGATEVRLSLPSSGAGQPVLQSVLSGEQESAIGPDSPYWMTVTQNTQAGSGEAYYEVTAPPAFSSSPTTSFSLRWIDFFR